MKKPNHTYVWNEIVSAADLAYIAGIIDGEGSIYATHRSGSSASHKARFARMSIACHIGMTDLGPIKFIASKFDCRIGIRKRTGLRDCFTIQITGNRSLQKFLTPLLPYLICKQQNAREAIEFAKTFKNRGGAKFVPSAVLENTRKKPWLRLRTLNHYLGAGRYLLAGVEN